MTLSSIKLMEMFVNQWLWRKSCRKKQASSEWTRSPAQPIIFHLVSYRWWWWGGAKSSKCWQVIRNWYMSHVYLLFMSFLICSLEPFTSLGSVCLAAVCACLCRCQCSHLSRLSHGLCLFHSDPTSSPLHPPHHHLPLLLGTRRVFSHFNKSSCRLFSDHLRTCWRTKGPNNRMDGQTGRKWLKLKEQLTQYPWCSC